MPEIILGKREFRLSGAERKLVESSVSSSIAARIEQGLSASRQSDREIRALAAVYRKQLKGKGAEAELRQVADRRRKRVHAEYERILRERKANRKRPSAASLRRGNFCMGHGPCLELPDYDFAQFQAIFDPPPPSIFDFGHLEDAFTSGDIGLLIDAGGANFQASSWALCAFWDIPDITGLLHLGVEATVARFASTNSFWFESSQALGTFNLGVFQYTRSPFRSLGLKAAASATIYDFGWNLFPQSTGDHQTSSEMGLALQMQVDPSSYYLCAAWVTCSLGCSPHTSVTAASAALVNSFTVSVGRF